MGLAGKNILVTGGTGFIGSHLTEKLLDTKCNVIITYQSLNPKSLFLTEKFDNIAILVQADLKNFKRTYEIVTRYEIDFIFHLAAQSIVPTAFYNPLETFETNIIGTAHILESARLYGKVQGIIAVSSDKAYGKTPRAVEESPLFGDHPYESSKIGCDLIATTYHKTYGLPVVVARFGNVYGEGDLNFTRIIPGIMQAMIMEKKLAIRSDGKYIRDYIYVNDVINALVLLAKNIKRIKGEAFNISSTENLSVLELMKKIEKIVGKKIDYQITKTAVNEIPKQSLSYAKIKKQLNWKPKHSLLNTIPQIYDWYENYFKD